MNCKNYAKSETETQLQGDVIYLQNVSNQRKQNGKAQPYVCSFCCGNLASESFFKYKIIIQ